jgi:hypothetical protein
VLKILKEAASPPRNVRIRILISAEDGNADRNAAAYSTTMTTTNERMQQLKELGIDVRRTTWQQNQDQQQNFLQNDNNLTLLIVDQSLSLAVELNDDEKKEETSEEDAIGLATYSNSDPTVFAYISIFENLWMRTEI